MRSQSHDSCVDTRLDRLAERINDRGDFALYRRVVLFSLS
jgi:hypothetical protein